MKKVVINACYGGYDLSQAAVELYKDWSGEGFCSDSTPRDDEHLIKVVEYLGEAANTSVSDLRVIEIPEDVDFVIQNYDGVEWVAEKHRTWR